MKRALGADGRDGEVVALGVEEGQVVGFAFILAPCGGCAFFKVGSTFLPSTDLQMALKTLSVPLYPLRLCVSSAGRLAPPLGGDDSLFVNPCVGSTANERGGLPPKSQ